MEEEKKSVEGQRPLTQRTWFIVLMFFLFWPCALWLLWRRGSKKAFIIATVLLVGPVVVYWLDPTREPLTRDVSGVSTTTQSISASVKAERRNKGMTALKESAKAMQLTSAEFDKIISVLESCNLDIGKLEYSKEGRLVVSHLDDELPVMNYYGRVEVKPRTLCFVYPDYIGKHPIGELQGIYIGNTKNVSKSFGIPKNDPVYIYRDGKRNPDGVKINDLFPTKSIERNVFASGLTKANRYLKKLYQGGFGGKVTEVALTQVGCEDGEPRYWFRAWFSYWVKMVDKTEYGGDSLEFMVDKNGNLPK